jgi:hypothetical protein
MTSSTLRRAAVGLAVAAVPAIAAPAALAAVNWQIPLAHSSAYPKATGSAQYQAQGSSREFQAEADHLTSLAGSRVKLYVNGVRIGSPLVSKTGIAQVSRNTDLGQSVPNVVHGTTVVFRTAAGVKILSGTF